MMILDSKAKHKLIDIDDPELEIYRIIEVFRLFDFFETKLLGLVAPKLWDDPYENILGHIRVSVKGKDNTFLTYKDYAELFFGQCWTLNNENDSTWRIYSPNKDRVKIKTTIKKLHDAICAIQQDFFKSYIGKVQYVTKEKYEEKIVKDIKDGGNFHRENFVNGYLLVKRDTFVDEKEIRLLVKLPHPEGNYSNSCYQHHENPDLCNIPVSDPTGLINEITFDPRTPDSLVKAYTNYLKSKFNYTKRIEKSDIYEKPDVRVSVDYKI